MNNQKRTIVLAVLFLLSITNFYRIEGIDSIRAVEFLSIFAIGGLSALLARAIIERFKN